MGRTQIYELDLAKSAPGKAPKKLCGRGCCSCCRCGLSARCVATIGCLIMAALLMGTLLVHFGVVALWINSPSAVDARNEAATREECMQLLEQRAQAGTLTRANNDCEVSGTSSVVLRLPNGTFIRGAIVHDGSTDDNSSRMTPNVTSATLDNSRHRRSINGGQMPTANAASSAPEADADDEPDGSSVTVIAHDSDLGTFRGVQVHLAEQPNSESETQDKTRHRRSAIGGEWETAQTVSSAPEADADDESDGSSMAVIIRDNDGIIHRDVRLILPQHDDASETIASVNPRHRRSAIGEEVPRNEAATREEECRQMLDQRAKEGTLTSANNTCEVSGTNLVVLRRTNGVFHTGIRVNGPNSKRRSPPQEPQPSARHRRSIDGSGQPMRTHYPYYTGDAGDHFVGVPYADPLTRPTMFDDSRRTLSKLQLKQDNLSPGPYCAQPAAGSKWPQAADCLRFNIVRPNITRSDALHPILVILHDGGLLRGGAMDLGLLGLWQNLAKRGLVVMVPQFRLGAAGFAGSPRGFTDIVVFLQWLRDNADAFGGDAARVTLLGIGSGACAASQIAMSTHDEELFHGIILVDGSSDSCRQGGTKDDCASDERLRDLICPHTALGTREFMECVRGRPTAEVNGLLSNYSCYAMLPEMPPSEMAKTLENAPIRVALLAISTKSNDDFGRHQLLLDARRYARAGSDAFVATFTTDQGTLTLSEYAFMPESVWADRIMKPIESRIAQRIGTLLHNFASSSTPTTGAPKVNLTCEVPYISIIDDSISEEGNFMNCSEKSGGTEKWDARV